MKQTICDAVYEAVKKYKPRAKTSWEDAGFLHFEEMLHRIKTNVQTAFWALTQLENFSDWENDFIVDFTEPYGTPIYKVGDFTFTIEYPPYDGDFIIKPAKKVTKTVVQTFWEFDNAIKI